MDRATIFLLTLLVWLSVGYFVMRWCAKGDAELREFMRAGSLPATLFTYLTWPFMALIHWGFKDK